jgi:hypothetical protein
MANYTGTIAVHQSLAAHTVDVVTLTSVPVGRGDYIASVMVVNRTGGAEIYITAGNSTAPLPPDPVVGGNDVFVLPASISTISIPVAGGGTVVKLISTGAEAYSVEALHTVEVTEIDGGSA